MKKSIMVWSMMACASLLIICGCDQHKYPWGKDTVALFGDGRFQVGRIYDDHKEIHDLYDIEKQMTIIYEVYSFQQDGNMVYAYGRTENDKYYVSLNYVTGEYSKYTSIEQAPAEIRSHLSQLSTNPTLPH